MGYFGLPSKACSPCRIRRITCDLATPSCGQCVRGRLTCFGYRNPTDLLFLDQSEDIACKVQRSKRTSRRRATEPATKVPPANSDSFHTASPLVFCQYSDAPPLSLAMAAENQASYFFFGNYSSRPSKNFRSVYEDIPALCDFEPSNSPLIYIVKALGLAGLSCHTETSGMEVAARAWYDKALQKINSSLRDRELVKGDQTLLVVLLFGLYETNTCNTPRSMKYWLNHVNGAAALLALRGEEQLDSEFGRTLFIHTRTQIVSACYQTRSSIPAIVVQLSQKCHDRNADPVESLIPIIFQFCNIRAEILFHPPTTQSESTTRATVTGYKSIAQALADWQDRIPVGFLPLTVSVGQASFDILSEHYNVYEDIWTAGIANNYRATSILVHEALISQLHFLRDYYAHSLDEVLELEDQILHSRNILLSLIDTVCASVPCLLRSNFAAAGVGLIWALYVSAQISPGVAPLQDATRRWIIGRLENIGAAMGVCQATMLAGFLRKRVEVMEVLKDEWAEGGGEGG